MRSTRTATQLLTLQTTIVAALLVSLTSCTTSQTNPVESTGTTRAAVTQAIPGLFTTGVDATGTILPAGSSDPHYAVTTTADPTNLPIGAAHVVPTNNFPNWPADTTTAEWVGTAKAGSAANDGDYVYETTFDLTGLDPTSASISFTWGSDNAGSVSLNGSALGITRADGDYAETTSATIVAGTGGATFLATINTLDFHVHNSGGATGLFVSQISGTAAGAPCTGDGPTGGCTSVSQPACHVGDSLAGECTQCRTGDTTLCTGTTPTCNDATGLCAGCNGDFGTTATLACPAAAAPFCDTATGACSNECTEDSECATGSWCNNLPTLTGLGVCQTKVVNGTRAKSTGGTLATCTTTLGTRACVSGVCDTNGNACGIKEGDGTCTSDTQCDAGFCVLSGTNKNKCEPCTLDTECTTADPACDTTTNQCVQCSAGNSTACTGTTPICNSGTEKCVACNGNQGSGASHACPVATPFCDQKSGACTAQCDSDAQCGTGNWCDNLPAGTGSGTCEALVVNGQPIDAPAPASTPATCTTALGARACVSAICDTTTNDCGLANGDKTCTSDAQCVTGHCVTSGTNAGKCEPCATSAQCSGATPVCDTTSNTCVQCTAASGAACNTLTPVCNTTTEKCVGCNGDFGGGTSEPCPTTAPFCTVATGACSSHCAVDTDCPTGYYCDDATLGDTFACTAKVPNNTGYPTGLTCGPSASRICVTGACDASGNVCGIKEGDGTCATTAQCIAGQCVTTGPNAFKCEPCTADTQCAAPTPACDTTTNTCVQCEAGKTSQCTGAHPLCNTSAEQCTACNGNFGSGASFACPTSATPFCAASGACTNSCSTDSDCPSGDYCDDATLGGTLTCKPQVGNGKTLPIGVSCTTTTETRVCVTGACDSSADVCGVNLGDGTCNADAQCNAGHCELTGPTAGTCVVCTLDSQCPSATPACDTTTNACVACAASSTATACGGNKPICNTSTDSCVACNGDSGSSATSACGAPTPYCSTSGACGACVNNASCTTGTHAGTICNAATGACGNLCNVDTDCPTGDYCDDATLGGTRACLPKVGNASPLPSPVVCNANGTRVCVSSACDATAGVCGVDIGDGTCASDAQCNSGHCILTGTNATKCEACGNDTQCGSSAPACDLTSNHCVQCTAANTTACTGTTPFCNTSLEQCAGCNGAFGSGSTFACPSSAPFCASGGACSAKCATDGDCGSGKYCDDATLGGSFKCVSQISNTKSYPTGVTCNATNGARVCVTGACDATGAVCGINLGDGVCDGDVQCNAGHCVPTGANANKCEACVSDTQCFGATPACDTTTNACVQCTSLNTSACATSKPVCDTTSETCKACNGDAGSSATFACGGSVPFCSTTGACGKCATNADCATGHAGSICNTSTGACGNTCSTDADCGSASYCDDATLGGSKTCQPKVGNTKPIPTGVTCTSASGARVCTSGACDVSGGVCGVNLGDGTCNGDGQCNSGHCVGSGVNLDKCEACANDGQCGGTTPACDGTVNACVQCTTTNASACTGSTPFCNTTTEKCTGCTGNFGASSGSNACPPTAPFCNTTSGACGTSCSKDSDCPSGDYCDDASLDGTGKCIVRVANGAPYPVGVTCSTSTATRVCQSGACDASGSTTVCGVNLGDGTCSTDTQCNAGHCVTSAGTNNDKCEPCLNDGQCSGTTSVCNVTTNQCVQCSATNEAACVGVTPVCDAPSSTCKACNGDAGSGQSRACSSALPYCSTTGACTTCANDASCTSGAHAGAICNPSTGACGSGCTVDSDCASTQWCDNPTASPAAGTCSPKVGNGGALPTSVGIGGICTTANGERVCLSAVCNDVDNLCGLPNSSACTGAAECRSTICNADGLCGQPNGQACAAGASECRSGACDGDGLCGFANGDGTCASDTQCRSSVCVGADGLCGALNGEVCTVGTTCRGNVCNADGRCGSTNGATCTTATSCRGGICAAGSCGGLCTTDSDCASGLFCDLPSKSCVPLATNGEAPNGGACTRGTQCVSGVCNADGNCGTPTGSACASSTECRGTAGCIASVCTTACGSNDAAGDSKCESSAWCDGTACEGAVANGVEPEGTACVRGAQCASGVCGIDGACGLPTGWACASGAMCRSGACDSAGACAASCVGDASCSSATYCDGTTSTCLPTALNGAMPGGAACVRGRQCASGYCDVASGSCGAPFVAACGPGIELCNATVCDGADNGCGFANGDGPCTAALATTVCRSLACSATDSLCGLLNGESCTTAGECRGGKCDPTAGTCVGCSSDGDCAAGSYCAGVGTPTATCTPKAPDGGTCTTGDGCINGTCTGGVCGGGDAGVDGGLDAATDAGVDGATDGADETADASIDGSTETGDATIDGASDAASDTIADAATDSTFADAPIGNDGSVTIDNGTIGGGGLSCALGHGNRDADLVWIGGFAMAIGLVRRRRRAA